MEYIDKNEIYNGRGFIDYSSKEFDEPTPEYSIVKRIFAALAASALFLSLCACGSSKTDSKSNSKSNNTQLNGNHYSDSKQRLIDVKKAIGNLLVESYSKGVFDTAVIDNGKVNKNAVRKDVEKAANWVILESQLTGEELDLLDQDGEVTTSKVIRNAFAYEDAAVRQNWSVLNPSELLDYGKVFPNEDDIKLVQDVTNIEMQMNQAVNNNLDNPSEQAKQLYSLLPQARDKVEEVLTTTPDDPTLVKDFALRTLLDLEDFVVNGDEDLISKCEERLFDHPIAGCMEAIYQIYGDDDSFRTIGDSFKIDTSSMKKKQIIAAIQQEYSSFDKILSFTDIIRTQYYGADFTQRLAKNVIDTFYADDEAFKYSNIIDELTDYIVDLLEKGELNQNIFSREYLVNLSSIGINAKFIATGNGFYITSSNTYVEYKEKKETVDPKDVPASYRKKATTTSLPGREGVSDTEADKAARKASQDAAEAIARGETPVIPDNLPPQEKEKVQEAIEKSQENKNKADSEPVTKERKEVYGSEEEVTEQYIVGGGIPSGSSYSEDVENIDMTIHSVDELENVVGRSFGK